MMRVCSGKVTVTVVKAPTPPAKRKVDYTRLLVAGAVAGAVLYALKKKKRF